jgi:hypothetical protein
MSVENLMGAMDAWYKARRSLEVAEATCEYDRHYFLHREYEAVSEAAEKFEAALNTMIDARLANFALRSNNEFP